MIHTVKLRIHPTLSTYYVNRRGRLAFCSGWADHIYNFHRPYICDHARMFEDDFRLGSPEGIEVRVSKRWHRGSVLLCRKGYFRVENVRRSERLGSRYRFEAGYSSLLCMPAVRFLNRIHVRIGDRFWVSIRPAKKGKKSS